MKKLLSAFLILAYFFSAVQAAFALDAKHRARITGRVGDGIRYYVTYELNGEEYRSDQVGFKMNQRMWALLDDEDRRIVTKTFAFAPAERESQFGGAGSKEMTDWVNEVQGWNQAAQILQERLVLKHYPALTEFFGDPSLITIGNISISHLQIQSLDLHNYDEASLLPGYKETEEKTVILQSLYGAGQKCLAALARFKTMQVSTAVKSISSDLIKLIADQVLVPNVLISPSARLSGAFSDLLSLIGAQTNLTDALYRKLTGETITAATAGEVIHDIWEIINNIEASANLLMDKCRGLISELEEDIPALREAAYRAVQENWHIEVERRAQRLNAIGESVIPIEYDFSSDAEEEEQRNLEIRAQAQQECDAVAGEYYAWKAAAQAGQQEVLDIIDATATDWGADWPSIPSSVTNEGGSILFDLRDGYSPDVIFMGHDYELIKERIRTKVAASKAYLADKRRLLNEYNEAAIELFEGKTKAYKEDIEPRLEGLKEYSKYIGIGQITALESDGDNMMGSLANMLHWRASPGSITISGYIEELEKLEECIDAMYAEFLAQVPSFEASVAAKYPEYLNRVANLENAAYFFVENYAGINEAREDFSFFQNGMSARDIMSVALPIVNSEQGLEAQRARGALIAKELLSFREAEFSFIRKMKAAREHVDYYAGELDGFLHRNFAKHLGNFGGVVGADIEASVDVLERIGYRHLLSVENLENYFLAITPTAALSEVISKALGFSKYFEELVMIEDEINHRKYDLLRLADDNEFNAQIQGYKNQLNFISNQALAERNNNQIFGFTQNAVEYYKSGIFMNTLMFGIELERYDYVPVTGIDFGEAGGGFFPLQSADYLIGVGESLSLSARVEPADATENRIIWSSSDAGVAAVDGEGNVFGKSDGIATITATAFDGGSFAEKTIQVGSGVRETFSFEEVALENEGGKARVGAVVISNSQEPVNALFTAALYQNKKMVGLYTKPIILYNEVPHGISFSADVSAYPAQGITSKILLWESAESLRPLAKAE